MNRHDRRKAKKLYTKMMPLDEVLAMPSGCAWEGCCKITENPDAAGWSKLVLYRGPTSTDFMEIDPRLMARDCVLCPEHARYLDERMLVDIGNCLRDVAGTA